MKLSIFGAEEVVEQVNMLKLEAGAQPGEIALIVCDNRGTRVISGTLLTITTDGRIRISDCVSNALGFQLDSRDRVKVTLQD